MSVLSVVMGPVPEDKKKTIIERLAADAGSFMNMKAENFIILTRETFGRKQGSRRQNGKSNEVRQVNR